MSRLLLTAAVLAVLVYTMVLGVRWLSPRIEQDIAGRVNTGLAEQGLLWADVDVSGRDVALSGVAPDADAKAKALTVASHVFGVSRVVDNLAVHGDMSATVAGVSVTTVSVTDDIAEEAKAAGLYTLQITKDGDKVTLSGSVPDEASKNVLVNLAQTHYGTRNVNTGDLIVVKGAPAGWRTAVGAVLMHISNLEQARVMISGTEVMVSGTVQDQEFSDKMESAVEQVLPKSYKVAFAVDVVSLTADVAPAAGDAANADKTCGDMKLVKQERLHFGFDKAELTEGHAPALKRVGDALKGCSKENLVVAGYTDVTGSPLYNKWLSQQRAEAGMRGLMREGIEKTRLQAVGYGDAYPIASNKTLAGRKQNRRVEFTPGKDLPHAVVKVSAPAKKAAAPAKKVEAKAEKPTPATIAKPWWAKPHDDSAEAVERKVETVVQPGPVTQKQPPMGAGRKVEERWLGDE